MMVKGTEEDPANGIRYNKDETKKKGDKLNKQDRLMHFGQWRGLCGCISSFSRLRQETTDNSGGFVRAHNDKHTSNICHLYNTANSGEGDGEATSSLSRPTDRTTEVQVIISQTI